MASVMDMNGNFLIQDEIVVKDRVYKLEQFRQFFDLQPIGKLRKRIHWSCTFDFSLLTIVYSLKSYLMIFRLIDGRKLT